VWDGEEGGKTHFQSSEIGAPVLGHIVENRVVQLALLDRIKASESVDYLCPCQLGDVDTQADRITCKLSSETGVSIPEFISTRLLIGADGARSRVRDMAGIATSSFTYPHHAMVATIETELPQQDITWQRFKPTGPEAFLPLCGERASMVWYNSEDEIGRLGSLNDDEFADAMQNTFPARLGSVRTILQRASFPIARAHAKTYLAERIALIGDAAHSVHPLAGQGVNLGMLDAAALAEVVIAAHNANKDIGSRRVLRQYERWRRGENAMMIAVLDGFYQAFKPQPAVIRTLRSTALSVADNAGLVKRLVMQQAMGTGPDLPQLAR
ncbi:MAG: FAD-dependent monooxygenase, partial [Granulosicoccus sp.]